MDFVVLLASGLLAGTLGGIVGAVAHALLLHQPRVHIEALQVPEIRTLKMRAFALPAFAATAFMPGFFLPGWNMLAMLPIVLIPTRARRVNPFGLVSSAAVDDNRALHRGRSHGVWHRYRIHRLRRPVL